MGSFSDMAIYFALLMAFAAGMTAWRLAVPQAKVRTQVDGLLGLCLVLSSGLFVLAVLPGAQLP